MNGTDSSIQPRQLFGGAITVDAPQSLIDASDIRQIPDNQEVFLYPNSTASIIVEILQCVDPTDASEIIKQSSFRPLLVHILTSDLFPRFHFDSLAHDNDAVSSEVLSITPPDGVARENETPRPIVLEGLQLVPKFNRQSPDTVQVLMAVYRIEHKRTDLVVTFNIPKVVHEGPQMDDSAQLAAAGHFATFVRSLRIVDFGLFA